MLQATILGCGSSVGVPVIGCECDVCSSDSQYNKRTRSAIYISDERSQILIDFGYDIRFQLLREKVKKLDAAILTHDHSDHINGIDDLRVFCFLQNKPLDVYFSAENQKIVDKYSHLFTPTNAPLSAKVVNFFDRITIKDTKLQFFKQYHGSINSLGIRIKDFVYSSDISEFPKESEKYLHNIKTWVIDCMDYTSNKNHSGLDKVLKWNEIYQPQQMLLTNMRHTIDYHKVQKILPNNISPLYDGYKFTI